MNTRNLLQRRLETVQTLATPGALQRGVRTEEGSDNPLENELTRQWETEARVIERVLDEEGEPAETLQQWRERTESFRERYPTRDGWTDNQGARWQVDLVLEAIDNILAHIENWSNEITIEPDDDA